MESTLEASCSSVFGDLTYQSCLVEETHSKSGYRVTVEWDDWGSALRVLISLESVTGRKVVRELSFDKKSEEPERWEAIGLVVAALVNAEIALSPKKKADEPPERFEDEPEVLAAEEPELIVRGPSTSGELGVLLAGGEGELLSLGGGLRLSGTGPSLLRPTGSIGALVGESPLSHFSFRATLGMEWWWWDGPVGVGSYLEGVLQLSRWSATRSGSTEAAMQPRYGGAAGLLFSIPFRERFGIRVRGAGTILAPPLKITVENQRVGDVGPWGWENSLAVWLSF